MVRKRKLLILTLLLALIFFPFLYAEEDESKAELNSIKQKKGENGLIQVSSDSLEKKSRANLKRFQLVKEENNNYKAKLNLNQKTPLEHSKFQIYLMRRDKLQKIERSLYTSSLVTYLALHVADYFSTREGLKYKQLKEGNPLMKLFVKNALVFTAVKICMTAYSFHYLNRLYKANKEVAWVVSTLSNFVLAYIVTNNIRLINIARLNQ